MDVASGRKLAFSSALLALATGLAPLPATAQTATDPRLVAAQKSYETLPEQVRKTIQTDLIWTGDFTGTASGSFGPLTFRAINAYKERGGAMPDGTLSPAERKSLNEAAAKARAAVKFEMVTDSRSGVRLGLPLGLLPRTEALPNGASRWQSADGRITLDTRIGQPGDTLPALFEKVSASTPTRKVTYKVIRPDFYVVSGETAGGKFFSRMAAGPPAQTASGPAATGALRGFSLGYDKALAPSFDRLVIAIANSFEPFAGAVTPASPAAPAIAAIPAAPTQPAARPAERQGTGLIVAVDWVVTAHAALDGCKTPPRVAGRPAEIRATAPGDGLDLLEVKGLGGGAPAGARLPLLHDGALAPDQRLVVLTMTETVPGQRIAAALPGLSVAANGGTMVRAPLQPGGAGSPVFDASGALAGLITGNPSERYLVAGVAVQRSYGFAGGAAIANLLGPAGIKLGSAGTGAERSTGAVVAGAVQGVVAVSCGL